MSHSEDLIRPAVILAAGEGRRLGGPKALFDLHGQTLLGRVSDACRQGGFAPLVAVVPTALIGEVSDRVSTLDAIVDNPDPKTGPLRSFQLALERLPADTPGTLMAMVDFALVQTATLTALAQALTADPGRLWRPVHQGRHGHPVWFPASLFGALRAAPLDQGARAVVYANRDLWGPVEVDDPWIHRDLDAPEDLEVFRAEAERRG